MLIDYVASIPGHNIPDSFSFQDMHIDKVVNFPFPTPPDADALKVITLSSTTLCLYVLGSCT
jgi:hypothetical protein